MQIFQNQKKVVFESTSQTFGHTLILNKDQTGKAQGDTVWPFFLAKSAHTQTAS